MNEWNLSTHPAFSQIIQCTGGNLALLRQVLQDWSIRRKYRIPVKCEFHLFHNRSGVHIIAISGNMPNRLFHDLVNYLHYPLNRKYHSRIRAWHTVGDSKRYKAGFVGKKVMLYIPEAAPEQDQVYALSEDGNRLHINFWSRPKNVKEETDWEDEPIDWQNWKYHEVVVPHLVEDEADFRNTNRANRRINLALVVVSVGWLLNYLLSSSAPRLADFIWFASPFAITIWWMADMAILRTWENLARGSLLWAAYFVIGWFAWQELGDLEAKPDWFPAWQGWGLATLALFFGQRLMRNWLGRFPNYDADHNKMAEGDWIYWWLLLLTVIVFGIPFMLRG